jgi:YtkA-like protein
MKAFRSLILLLVASSLMLFAGCAKPNYEDPQRDPAANQLGNCDAFFSHANACIDLIWEKKPTKDDMGSFVVEFYNPDDRSQFIDLHGTLDVVLWMPSMGHGSSPVTVEKLAPGQYRVSKVYFIMPGDWEIQFKLKNGDTVLEQAALPYRY